MKIAVIADIHSNIYSLNLALNDAFLKNVERFVFLGDNITDGFMDNEVIDMVFKYADYSVKGNREKYILDIIKNKEKFNGYKNKKPLFSTIKQLNQKSVSYISSLKDFLKITINNKEILLIHGDKPAMVNLENNNLVLEELITRYDFDVCLYGHSHIYSDFEYKGKRFISPGSIGQPNDGPYYKYGILDITEDIINFELVTFNTNNNFDILKKDYINSMYYVDNPEWCNLILDGILVGKNYSTDFVIELNNIIDNMDAVNENVYNQLWDKHYKNFINKL